MYNFTGVPNKVSSECILKMFNQYNKYYPLIIHTVELFHLVILFSWNLPILFSEPFRVTDVNQHNGR